MDGVLGEAIWVGGHGNVGEQGGVVGRDGNGYARVGGGEEGGAGGKSWIGPCGHGSCWIDGLVHNIGSRLTYVQLRSKLRSKLRP